MVNVIVLPLKDAAVKADAVNVFVPAILAVNVFVPAILAVNVFVPAILAVNVFNEVIDVLALAENRFIDADDAFNALISVGTLPSGKDIVNSAPFPLENVRVLLLMDAVVKLKLAESNNEPVAVFILVTLCSLDCVYELNDAVVDSVPIAKVFISLPISEWAVQ